MRDTLSDMAEKKEETETVRLRRSLLRRIARIAAHQDVSVPDYLARVLEPIVDADEAKMLEELKVERGEKKPRKS